MRKNSKGQIELDDLTGLRFGQLVVIGKVPASDKRNPKWQCRCDCGKITTPFSASLRNKKRPTKSCGCLRLAIIGKFKICPRCKEKKLHKHFSKRDNKPATYCKPCLSEVQKEKYLVNPEEARARVRAANRAFRQDVLNAYGRECACCGEKEEGFLAVDHTHGGGGRHRKELGFSGARFYRWLKESGFPPEYQILCHNCNWGKHLNKGFCPHRVVELTSALSFGA